MGNDRNRLQKLFEISIAKFDHFLFNYTVIEIDLEIDRNISVDIVAFRHFSLLRLLPIVISFRL